jgi:hypothetical protein
VAEHDLGHLAIPELRNDVAVQLVAVALPSRCLDDVIRQPGLERVLPERSHPLSPVKDPARRQIDLGSLVLN